MPPTILTLGILNETPHSSHEDLTNPLEQLRILFVERVVLVLKCSVVLLSVVLISLLILLLSNNVVVSSYLTIGSTLSIKLSFIIKEI